MAAKGSNYLDKRPKGWITTVLLVLLLLAVAVTIYLLVRKREGFADSAEPVVVTAFLMEGCPYCVQFKPEWAKFEKMIKEQGLAIQTRTVDSSDKKTTNQYGVSGFPTIYVEKGKNRKLYDGKRTADDLMAFAKKF